MARPKEFKEGDIVTIPWKGWPHYMKQGTVVDFVNNGYQKQVLVHSYLANPHNKVWVSWGASIYLYPHFPEELVLIMRPSSLLGEPDEDE